MDIIERVIRILQCVSRTPKGMTLSEIACATKLPPPTIHRLLTSLAQERIVERNESSKRWGPGVVLMRIAASLDGAMSSEAAADRIMMRLWEKWMECVYLGVLSEGEVVAIRRVERHVPHRLSVSLPLGRRLPLHASASAKAIVAQLETSARRELVLAAPLTVFTDKTLSTIEEVEQDLDATRTRGYAVCDEEIEYGVLAYAFPVLARDEGAVRSLGVMGPHERLQVAWERGLEHDLADAAQHLGEISHP